MSDESTIAAATLLPSLLGGASSNALQTTPLQTAAHQPAGKPAEISSFEQILASNLDAGRDFAGANDNHDASFGSGLQSVQLETTTDTPRDFFTDRARSRSEAMSGPSSLNGNLSPLTGNSLPENEVLRLEEDSLNPLLSNPASNSELNTAGETEISDSKSNVHFDSEFGWAEGIRDDASQFASQNIPLDPVASITQAPGETPALSGGSAADNAGAGLRDTNPVTADRTTQSAVEDRITGRLMEDNPELSQQGSDRNGNQDILQESGKQQRVTAEFSLDEGRIGNTSFPPTGTSASTGDIAATALNALNTPLASNSPTSASQLSLVSDRNLAGAQVAQHVASFIRQGDEFAEINLSPPHLGKISVQITLQNDQASVVLTAPSPEIRDVIEASLPRLSNLLQDAGLQLADANVSSQEQNTNPQNESTGKPDNPRANDMAPETTVPRDIAQSRGLLDAYA